MKGEFITLSNEISDPRFGKYPSDRSIDDYINRGIIFLDKPSGPTSHQVTSWVKDILGVDKAGHSGTLDPKTTGFLLIALGKSTKAMPLLKDMDKEYVTVMELHDSVDAAEFMDVVDDYTGEIKQVPPKKSAVKRRERVREVKEMEVLDWQGSEVLLRVRCEAGTYIRKLIHDMGQDLDVGAHMSDLRRTSVGPYSEDMLVDLYELKDSYEFYREDVNDDIFSVVKPVEIIADICKSVIVKDTAVGSICNGAPLGVGGISRLENDINPGELVSILSLKGELIAIGEAEMSSDEMVDNSSGKAVSLKNVFMSRDTYPNSWR